LSYSGNLQVEIRHGLVVNAKFLQDNGREERDAFLPMLEKIAIDRRITEASDNGLDTHKFVVECRQKNAAPRIAQKANLVGGSAIYACTTPHEGYAVTRKKRKRMPQT